MKQQIILVGAYHEMIEVCEDAGFEIVGIIDNKETGEYYGVPVIGTDEDAEALNNIDFRASLLFIYFSADTFYRRKFS